MTTGKWTGRILPTAFILLVLVVWELVTQLTTAVPEYVLPPPTAIFDRIVTNIGLLADNSNVNVRLAGAEYGGRRSSR